MVMSLTKMLISVTLLFGLHIMPANANWDSWWTYSGISGPGYWGRTNPSWSMCNKGMKQSPINLDPNLLHYDSSLTPIRVDKQSLSGRVTNTGQSLVFKVDEGQLAINITGGPLAYRYQFEEIYFHWGDEGKVGSEHTVNNQTFPGEIQIYGFSPDLSPNISVARQYPGGLVALSVFLQIRNEPMNSGEESSLHKIINQLREVVYKGGSTRIPHVSLASILPATEDYITYEGSTTYPGCWETVTWIVYNRPAYITSHQMKTLRRLKQGDRYHEKAPLGNNIREIREINNRALRTNIAFAAQKAKHTECFDPSSLLTYQTNGWVTEKSKIEK